MFRLFEIETLSSSPIIVDLQPLAVKILCYEKCLRFLICLASNQKSHNKNTQS